MSKIYSAIISFFTICLLPGCGSHQDLSTDKTTRPRHSDDGLPNNGETMPSSWVLKKQAATIPSDWKQIKTNAKFIFSVPADLNPVAVQPFDSYVELYRNTSLAIIFDYGMYSGHTDNPDELIDGRPAKIENRIYDNDSQDEHYTFLADVHFQDIGRGESNLSIAAYYKSADDLEIAKNIFRSIDFE